MEEGALHPAGRRGSRHPAVQPGRLLLPQRRRANVEDDTEGARNVGKQRKVEEVTQHVPRSNETVTRALNSIHGTTGLTWLEMAEIIGVPAGTLWDIANGRPVPNKWRKQLGLAVYRDLFAMPVKELRWAIENRTAVMS